MKKITHTLQFNNLYMLSYKYYILSFLILFINHSIFSQNPGNVAAYDVWIKNTKVDKNSYANSLLNYHQPIKKIRKTVIRNIVNNQYSLFIVFSSHLKAEKKILKLKKGKDKTFVTNYRIISNSEKVYDKKVDQGIFVSYLSQQFENNSFRNYFKVYDGLLKNKDIWIYEILYYPKYLNITELAKVQTYFSLKYGISLPERSVYLNSKADTIWNPDKNKNFNHNITGLGQDEALNLKQFQSHNSIYKNLSIAFNKKSVKTKHKKFYLLFGDNGKEVKFTTSDDDSYSKLDRVWKVNVISDIPDFSTNAKFNLSLKPDDSKGDLLDDLWLIIDDNSQLNPEHARLIKGELKNNVYHFKDISFLKQHSYFSFVKIPDMISNIEITQPSCVRNESGQIDINIKGGMPPYTIRIESDEFSDEDTTDDTHIVFSDLTEGTYHLTIQDKNANISTEDITIEPNDNLGLELKSKWILEHPDDEVEIHFNSNKQLDDSLEYAWYYGDELVGTGQTFKTNQCGIYHVVVKNLDGCEQKSTFSVETGDDMFAKDISIYPNPINVGEKFKVSFILKKQSDVNISVYNFEGKLLMSDDLNGITELSKDYTINTNARAVYWVVVKSNNNFTTKRLIIK